MVRSTCVYCRLQYSQHPNRRHLCVVCVCVMVCKLLLSAGKSSTESRCRGPAGVARPTHVAQDIPSYLYAATGAAPQGVELRHGVLEDPPNKNERAPLEEPHTLPEWRRSPSCALKHDCDFCKSRMSRPITGAGTSLQCIASQTAPSLAESYARAKSNRHLHSCWSRSARISINVRCVANPVRKPNMHGSGSCCHTRPALNVLRSGGELSSRRSHSSIGPKLAARIHLLWSWLRRQQLHTYTIPRGSGLAASRSHGTHVATWYRVPHSGARTSHHVNFGMCECACARAHWRPRRCVFAPIIEGPRHCRAPPSIRRYQLLLGVVTATVAAPAPLLESSVFPSRREMCEGGLPKHLQRRRLQGSRCKIVLPFPWRISVDDLQNTNCQPSSELPTSPSLKLICTAAAMRNKQRFRCCPLTRFPEARSWTSRSARRR